MKTKLYINGLWKKGLDKPFDVINPATEKIITKVESASKEQALKSISKAAKAQKKWAAKTPRERAEVLRKAYELMIEQKDYLADLITQENGKASKDAMSEVIYAAEFFRWFAEEAVRSDGIMKHSPSSKARILVQHKPAGVAVLITPWNYPAAMGTRKIAPALAAGCSVVIKPAAETPLSMLALMPILEKAGTPIGVVNVLPTRHSAEVVSAMMNAHQVRVISFTGSTKVGKILLKEAANLVLNPAMELGGNAPVIVFEDADIDKAVEGVMLAKLRNIGEACTAANRIYIHQAIEKTFTEKLKEKMAKLKVGNGQDKSVDIGPLVNAQTRDKVEFFVDDAIHRGGRVLLGGQRIEGKGYFYPPTIITNVPDEALGFKDEIFGPVAMLQSFNDSDDIVAKANNTPYGLIAYVFTQDINKGLRVSEQLEFAMVGLNRGLVSDPAAPFGGMKQSGLGREGAHEGLLEFMETQYISMEW